MSGTKQFFNSDNAISRRAFLKASALTVGGTLLALCWRPARRLRARRPERAAAKRLPVWRR